MNKKSSEALTGRLKSKSGKEISGAEPVFKNSTGTKNSEASESVAFYKIWKNSTEMHLMSERNRNFLKTRKSAELADNSAE
jgi:hypothetical protein